MNNKYELTITKDYVPDWGIQEALRELFQNCIDGGTAGYKADISYEDETLIISNELASLDISKLTMGNTSKSNGGYIGEKGEGMKLALLVLVREGYSVIINNDGETWIPTFEYSDKFETELLTIERIHTGNSGLSFTIENISNDIIENAKEKFLILRKHLDGEINSENGVDTKFGRILLEKEYAGNIYVKGLFVQHDNSFKCGYDFSSDYVKLDRDRKAINIYDLKRLTAKSWVTSKDNYKLFNKLLKDSSSDVGYINDCLSWADPYFVNGYKEYYNLTNQEEIEQYGDKKVIYSGETKIVNYINNKCEEEGSNIIAVKESGVISKLLNGGNNTVELYEEYKSEYTSKNVIEQLLEDFEGSQYKDLLDWIETKFQDGDINQDDINELLEITDDMIISGWGKISEAVQEGYSFKLE